MTWNWQDIAALSIVSIAVVYVTYLAYRRLRRTKKGSCGGGCFGCQQPRPESAKLVTSISMSESVDKHESRIA